MDQSSPLDHPKGLTTNYGASAEEAGPSPLREAGLGTLCHQVQEWQWLPTLTRRVPGTRLWILNILISLSSIQPCCESHFLRKLRHKEVD